MATHSSPLAWQIPWTEEPGGLQSMGSLGVGHEWATSLSLFTFMHWRRKWQPTPVFLPGESQGQGAWWAAVYGVAQSWTRLKWLSSSTADQKNVSRLESLTRPTPTNIHFKTMGLELTIERFYQTHSHNIHFKVTGSVRRFSKRRNILKQDTLLLLVQNLREKHILEQD